MNVQNNVNLCVQFMFIWWIVDIRFKMVVRVEPSSNNSHTMVWNVPYSMETMSGKAVTKESFQMKRLPVMQLLLRSSYTVISTVGAVAPPLIP